MVPIAPARPRSRVIEDTDGVRFIIPARCHWYAIFFLPVWLAFWTYGGFEAASQLLLGGGNPGGQAFLALWLCFWAFGEGWVLYTIAWNLMGREVIRVNEQSLTMRREVFGLGRSREFEMTLVRDIRCSPSIPWNSRGNAFQEMGMGGGLIAFDYGAKTYRFGAGIEEAEARMLVAAIKARFPELDRQAGV